MDLDRRAMLLGSSAVMALPAAGTAAALAQGASGDVGADARRIIARYVERIRAAGTPIPAAPPRLRLQTEPTLSSYRDQVVTLPIWETAPPPLHNMLDQLAAMTGGLMSGEALFRTIFNWFIIPHELTHWYEDALGWEARHLDHYQTELRCNRVAVAFWAEEPGGPQRLERLFEALAKINMPSPVPAGADAPTYFNANYLALANNPAAYGWYQFELFREAWKLRGSASFAQLIRDLRGERPAAFRPIDDYIAAFNGGDWERAASCFTPGAIIIDNSPPFTWSGPDAFRRWLHENQTGWARTGITSVSIGAGRMSSVQMTDVAGYVVVPASESFTQGGRHVSQPGRFTFTLAREAGVWRIAGWAWTDDPRS